MCRWRKAQASLRYRTTGLCWATRLLGGKVRLNRVVSPIGVTDQNREMLSYYRERLIDDIKLRRTGHWARRNSDGRQLDGVG